MTARAAVIVGTSIAGVRTAQALRRAGYDGSITLAGQEHALPYDKPPLSKGFLAGTSAAHDISLLPVQDAAALELTLRLGQPAVWLDLAERHVVLAASPAARDQDDVLPYDDLVIATGARARPSPWPAARGVHVLRSLEDSQALRASLQGGGDVVIVGAGFIGSEVASTCRALGHRVTLVDPVPVPMARLVGAGVGSRLAALHERHGVRTRFGVGVGAITGQAGDLLVTLTDGTVLPCATVVAGIGAIPNTEWLAGSGLVLDDGVLCDEFGRTSAPSVYALGDVARWHHPGKQHAVRPEHWTNAVDQARCVARTIMASQSAAEPGPGHHPVEFVWSDQYDWKLHIAGDPSSATQEETVELNDQPQAFATLYGTGDGPLCGAVAVNWPKASIVLRRGLAQELGFEAALDAVRGLVR